jgi:hypothetical protein
VQRDPADEPSVPSLPPDLLVLRFAPMGAEVERHQKMIDKAFEHARADATDELYLSVFVLGPASEMEDTEIAAFCGRAPVSGKWIWPSTCGALQERGFRLKPTPPPVEHHDVQVGFMDSGNDVLLETVTTFVEAFGERFRNPAWSS